MIHLGKVDTFITGNTKIRIDVSDERAQITTGGI